MATKPTKKTPKTIVKTAVKKTTAKKAVAKKTPKTAQKSAVKKVVPKTATKKSSAKIIKKLVKSAIKTTVKIKAKTAPKAIAKSAKKTTNKPSKLVTFRINRSSWKKGKLKRWVEEFPVKYDSSTTILQALEDIKGQQDGSLTFRRSCRASICGSCGMFINNRSRLACQTKVRDITEGNPSRNLPPADIIELSPQQNQPVMRDLAVDIRPFYDKVESITPYVQKGEETQKNVDKTSFEQVNMVSNCIMCGCCYSDCTAMAANPDYIGPAALAKAFRFVADPRDGQKTQRLKFLSEENGIWDCLRCGMCVDACPKDVAPMEAIAKLRTRAIAKGITNNGGAKHAMCFKDDIANIGTLDEFWMLPKTLGLGIFGQFGNAINMLKKGKIPEIFPDKLDALEEVKAIYKELEENPIEVETKQEDTGPGAG